MIYNVLAQIKEWFIWLFAQISALPVLWQEDRELFFFLVAGFCAVILIIVLTIILIKKHKNKKATPEDVYLSDYNIVNKPKMTKFIPVEYLEPDVDSNDLMLSLEDRIIACQDGITSDARERIVKNSPQSLSVLVNVYTKCSPATQQDMLKIVRELHMMEEYSKHLLQEGYHQGVLISAWQFFPDVNVLRSFVGLLASRQEEMQHAAVRLLSTLQEPKVLPILVLALIQPNIYVPARVAEVFISMPEQSANLCPICCLK